jgi:GNAT superfamily N-acetyltransferase
MREPVAGTRFLGYVLGCGDTQRRLVVVRSRILPEVLCGLFRGRYQIGRKTLRLGWRFLLDRLEHPSSTVSLARFPGHLHINVAAPGRRHGIGGELLRTSLDQFWATGVPGVHLRTTNHNRAACHLYEKAGFRLLDAQATHVWRGLIACPVENRVYGIKPGWR